MQIFSGSTNQAITKNIAEELGCGVGRVELSLFPNNEVRIWVSEEKIDKEVVVVQSFSGNPNRAIIEFCLLMDALRRSGARDITAVIPWMGYCIQDKVFRQGEPLSARVIADIIQSVKPDKVITVDLHNDTIQGFFTVPTVHLSATPLFVSHFKSEEKVDCVVAPDVGALKETTKISQALELPVVILNKKRDLHTGKVEIVGADGDVTGKTALIMDDFINTGSTIVQTADFLKTQGVQKVIVAVTHMLFVPGVMEKLAKSALDELYISDTVAMPHPKPDTTGLDIHIISMAEVIAKHLG